jgi:hypothetical protein
MRQPDGKLTIAEAATDGRLRHSGIKPLRCRSRIMKTLDR